MDRYVVIMARHLRRRNRLKGLKAMSATPWAAYTPRMILDSLLGNVRKAAKRLSVVRDPEFDGPY
jgi:hypothetical protein